jgi:NADH-quinone oxidoreductase subunit E
MLRAVIEDNLHLESGDTTEDGLFTLDPVACIGCCSLAPVIMVNDQTHGRLTPKKLRNILRTYRREGMAELQGGKE